MRREYKTGSKYAVWRWKDIFWNGELYLRRLIIFQTPLFSAMLHWIHTADQQRHLHDHPVSMLSIILKGAYTELVDVGDGHVVRQWRNLINWIPATKRHRIDHVEGEVLTFCLASPRLKDWGFYTEKGWIHWQEYHKQYESGTS